METPITSGQIRIINTIISKKGLQHVKAEIVSGFSMGRVTSTSDLYYSEAAQLIKHLNADKRPSDDPSYKMRGKILSLTHQMNWHIPGSSKIDFPRLNEWCVKFGYLHKRLDRYSYQELPKLVSQFEVVFNDFIKKI